MEAQWIADRAALRTLAVRHPTWGPTQLARLLGYSRSWVKKWLKRLQEAPPHDLEVLRSHSRARHTPPPAYDPSVVQRIIEIRVQPPEGLQRLPGPRTILYYLHRDPDLRREGARLPRSPRTIWRLLHQTGLLVEQEAHEHHLLPRPGPLQEVQVDFKDASTVRPDPSEPGSKQQHVVEICNAVDAGTSIWLDAQVHADFHAETALQAVINFLFTYGCPPMMTFDHDPRWVGSRSGRDFPSALCRFLRCVGVEPHLCPPHQPQKNAFVERLHRSLKEECLLVHHPGTLQEVRTVTAQYQHHYNQERPHQGFSCRNQPPRVAFPTLPTLPPLPDPVDPDAWLQALHGHALARKIGSDGCVTVDGETYYISRALCGQQVALLLNAPERALDIWLGDQTIKQLPLKGLIGHPLPLSRYIQLMLDQARSEERQLRFRRQRLVQHTLWA